MSRIDAEKRRGREFIEPSAVGSEMALLGALMVNPEFVPLVSSILDYGHFYAPIHPPIYKAIVMLFFREQRLDRIAVAQELAKTDDLQRCGDVDYLSQLMDSVQTSATVVYHAKLIREKAVLRELISAGRKIYDLGHDGEDDVDAALSEAESALADIRHKEAQVQIGLPPTLGDLHAQAMTRPPLKFGMRYGFGRLDERTLGMQPRQITTVGARTGAGKSAFAEHVAIAAGTSHSVLYVPLEMGHEYTADRFCARLAGKPINDFMRGGRCGVPVQIDSVYDIRVVDDAQVRDVRAIESLVRRVEPKLLILDHAAHIAGWYDDGRRADLGAKKILQALHDMVMRTGIHLLILQQLNRDADGQRPSLKDLRDTGAFEEISTRVLLLHHPFETTPENDTIVEIFAAKDRAAGKRMYHVGWRSETMSFIDLPADIAEHPSCCMPGSERRKRGAA